MTNKTTKTLHFNFTPVQSFVAQARRTRDLWAGSYLLSWLSGQAMNAILNNQGDMLMPDVEGDKLILAIQSPNNADELAKSLGTMPNRFTARIPEDQDPKVYSSLIQAKWLEVANAVRQKIDPDHLLIEDAFWERQIKHHWEFTWVIGEESYLLDSRKNLRLPRVTEEKGEKCTVCGERQELSESRQSSFQPNRNKSKKWWQTLPVSNLDLRENERLCAVCVTKRLFPLVAEQAIGWKVDRHYPSTAYLSAIDWLEELLTAAKTSKKVVNAANQFVGHAKQLHLQYSEKDTVINGLSALLKDSDIDGKLLDLDGDAFFQEAIDSNEKVAEKNKPGLKKALIDLQNAVGSSATPFYALLLMDGDGMGKLIGGRSVQDRKALSKALAEFTGHVPDIVKGHNGKLIYAGGDDVFALLPVSSAIRCAAECKDVYKQVFAQHDMSDEIKKQATISAAIQFAHQNIALSVVVQDAHHLLDEIAKERTGRNALACRVWKPGGIVLTWAQPWSVSEKDQEIDFVQLIYQVRDDFYSAKQGNRFSSKFFYKLSGMFEQIQGGNNPEDLAIFTDDDVQDLLIAEYLANREHDWQDQSEENKDLPDEQRKASQRQQAKEKIARLLKLCQEQRRDSKQELVKGLYNSDAALLVRFLVQKEV